MGTTHPSHKILPTLSVDGFSMSRLSVTYRRLGLVCSDSELCLPLQLPLVINSSSFCTLAEASAPPSLYLGMVFTTGLLHEHSTETLSSNRCGTPAQRRPTRGAGCRDSEKRDRLRGRTACASPCRYGSRRITARALARLTAVRAYVLNRLQRQVALS